MELLRPRVFILALHVSLQIGQGPYQHLRAVHHGPCTSAPHHFQSSACQPSPSDPDFTKLETASDGRENVLVLSDVFSKFKTL